MAVVVAATTINAVVAVTEVKEEMVGQDVEKIEDFDAPTPCANFARLQTLEPREVMATQYRFN